MASLDQRLQDELEQEEGASRFLDLCLILRRAKTKETLLWAGGQWDRRNLRFTDVDPEQAKVVDLEESQVEFTRWYAGWLRDFREGFKRDTSLAAAGGDRRGGKTFDLLMCTLATAIDVPIVGERSALVGWVVSVNYQERDEVDRQVREWIPREWYSYRKAPEFRYTFAHGSSIRNVSADDPETLKRGRVDVVFFNEAQKMPIAALSNGIYGTVDKGGIALLAANPPRRQVGEWVLSLKEAIEEKRLPGAKFFGFSSKNNTQIEREARGRVGDILRIIDPRAAVADDEGAWLPVGDRAYPKWNKLLLRPDPGTGDITPDYLKRRIGKAFASAAGADFQGFPHHVAVAVKVYPGADGKNVYQFVDEFFGEHEDDLIDTIEERHDHSTLMVIGDASGAWQDGKHKFNGRVSYDFFKARRFVIEPPQKKKRDKSEHSKNPPIEDRLSLVFRLMEAGRLFVDPQWCPRLAEAFKDCELNSINGRKKPTGRHAHITDAAGYVLYWLEPKPAPKYEPRGPDAFSIPFVRRGSDVI